MKIKAKLDHAFAGCTIYDSKLSSQYVIVGFAKCSYINSCYHMNVRQRESWDAIKPMKTKASRREMTKTNQYPAIPNTDESTIPSIALIPLHPNAGSHLNSHPPPSPPPSHSLSQTCRYAPSTPFSLALRGYGTVNIYSAVSHHSTRPLRRPRSWFRPFGPQPRFSECRCGRVE